MSEETITITVTDKADVDWIRSKVRAGHFDSEADVVAESISSLRKEEEQVEVWLRDVVAERYDRLKANPESGIPIEQVIKNLEKRRKKRAELNQ